VISIALVREFAGNNVNVPSALSAPQQIRLRFKTAAARSALQQPR
jgi:hypothetical protein